MTTLELARAYVAAGLSVIPIRSDGSKAPALGSWKKFQLGSPLPYDLQQWFAAGSHGLAVLGGAVSGGLEILDFEAPEVYLAWRELVEAETAVLLCRLPTVRTPRGHHVYFRCPGHIQGNQKLARAVDAHGEVLTVIETRGEGGYVLAPGCPPACHPTGRRYELLPGPDLAAIPEVSADERELLLTSARALNRYAEPAASWDQPAAAGQLRPGDDYERRTAWAALLEPAGWVRVREHGGLTFWRRPGKDHGWSATTGMRSDCSRDLLYVFTSNAHPFQSERSYSKFAAFAVLRHAGDYQQAARALAERGYGEQRPASGRPRPGSPGRGRPEAGPSQPPAEEQPPEPIILLLSDVQAQPVEWLWENWIPRGTLTVLDGDPGMGKSTLTIDLAARVSRGWDMPPGGGPCNRPAAGVLLLSAEDDAARTIRPRLDAAGGDPARVQTLEAVRFLGEDRPAVLPVDLELLAGVVVSSSIQLVVIDPFAAFLGQEFDAHKDQDIRRCLHRLAKLACQLNIALLLVRHLNKMSGGPALYRGGGSIGIVGAARAALVVGRDPDDETAHVLAMNKSNLGPIPKPLAYRLETMLEGVARVGWLGERNLHAEDILWHHQGRRPEGRPDLESKEARQFLADLLAEGAMPATRILASAKAAGISEKTIRRAKQDLAVTSLKQGDTWYWGLSAGQGGQNSPEQ